MVLLPPGVTAVSGHSAATAGHHRRLAREVGQTDARDQQPLDTGGPTLRPQHIAVGVEFGKIEMTVAVKQRHGDGSEQISDGELTPPVAGENSGHCLVALTAVTDTVTARVLTIAATLGDAQIALARRRHQQRHILARLQP